MFSYNLEWREYFLDQDVKYADRFIGSATLGRVFLNHPYLMVSYTFYHSNVEQTDNFSQELLTKRENAHGLGFYLEGQLSSYVSGWLTGGVRRDEGRELTSMEVGLGLRWQILPGLTIMPSYFYSSESQSVGADGETHTFMLETEYLL